MKVCPNDYVRVCQEANSHSLKSRDTRRHQGEGASKWVCESECPLSSSSSSSRRRTHSEQNTCETLVGFNLLVFPSSFVIIITTLHHFWVPSSSFKVGGSLFWKKKLSQGSYNFWLNLILCTCWCWFWIILA